MAVERDPKQPQPFVHERRHRAAEELPLVEREALPFVGHLAIAKHALDQRRVLDRPVEKGTPELGHEQVHVAFDTKPGALGLDLFGGHSLLYARIARDPQYVGQLPELVRHGVQQHPVGENHDLLGNAGIAADSNEIQQLRMEQRLAADQRQLAQVHDFGQRPDIAFELLEGRKLGRKQRGRVIAIVAAEIAMLGKAVLDCSSSNPAARALDFFHVATLGEACISAV